MAPLASEPRQVLTILNLARRKALYTLAVEITAYMRSQIEFHEPAGNTQLLIDPSAENSIIVSAAQPGSAGGGDTTPPSPALVRLRAAAIQHFDAWRKDILNKFKELLSTPDDSAILEERRKRADRMAQQQRERERASAAAARREGNNDLIDASWDAWPVDDSTGSEAKEKADRAKAVARLQAHWHPIPTRLVTIPYEDRLESLSCLLLVLLSTGRYSADSRALTVYLASALELSLEVLNAEEMEIAKSLVEGSARAAAEQRNQGQQGRSMSAQAEAEKRKQENQASRYWKVGLASVAGAAIIGVTGGLAAPVVAGAIGGIMGSVGLGGVASFLGIFWMNGALVGTLFGAMGARMTGEMVDQYAREVEDFKFIPLKDEWGTRDVSPQDRRLRVTIGINGWLDSEEDVTRPWRTLGTDSEAFALRYEMKSLLGLGKTLKELVSSYAWNTVKVEILKRTVLATLWSALWPAYLLSMAAAVDNPFSLAKNRSEKAGEILADALINKVQGERPVTLVGYSLGARVIYSCLRSLAARRAFGLVDTVVLIGAPIPSNRQHWQMMRTVVSGKIFNVYSENDYLLAFLYRATSIQLGVAGLQEIKNVEGLENLDLSNEVQGHMRYAKIIPQILARCNIPVVKGADAPIAEEGDIIKLDDLDKDNSEMSNLIELDDLNNLSITDQSMKNQPPPPVYSAMPSRQLPHVSLQNHLNHPLQKPLNPSPSTQPNPPRQIQRTAVTRTSPSALSTNQDPLGLGLLDTPMAQPSPPPQPPRPTRPAQPAQLAQPTRSTQPARAAQPVQRTPTAPQPLIRPPREPSPPKFVPVDDLDMKFMMPDKLNRSLPAYGAPLQTASAAPASPEPVSRAPVSRTQSAPAPVYTSSHRLGPTDDHDDDDDDDGSDEEGGWGGIKMVDNEDGLAYLDPSPIQD